MDQRDRAAIEDLFRKIATVEQQTGPRDREAETFIRAQIAARPAAPYLMAQTIIVQEQALYAAQQRIEELEAEAAGASGGGLLGGLFGAGRPARQERPDYRADRGRAASGPWSGSPGMMRAGGGGFLAGAAQTAMGVAGGVVLGNMIADWMSPDAASAGDFADSTGGDEGGFFGAGDQADTQLADAGDAGDVGGDFDFGDF